MYDDLTRADQLCVTIACLFCPVARTESRERPARRRLREPIGYTLWTRFLTQSRNSRVRSRPLRASAGPDRCCSTAAASQRVRSLWTTSAFRHGAARPRHHERGQRRVERTTVRRKGFSNAVGMRSPRSSWPRAQQSWNASSTHHLRDCDDGVCGRLPASGVAGGNCSRS